LCGYTPLNGAVGCLTPVLAGEIPNERIGVDASASGLIQTEQNPTRPLTLAPPGIPVRTVDRAEEVADDVAWVPPSTVFCVFGAL
jgi:hypothetical protein